MKDYILLLDENEKLKRIVNAYEFYDDEVKSTTTGERVFTFKMNDSVVDIENGNKIGIFLEDKFDLFIVDQVEAETYYSTSIKVTCLHDFYSIQTQKAITQYYKESVSVHDAITEMLKGTSYELGECVERSLIPIGPYLFKNPLWCIQDIISNFGVEIEYSIELNETRTGIARKLVHVVNALGSDTGVRCSTDLNVSKIKRIEKDKFYTVMYGCGSEYQKDLVKYKYDFKDISWSTSNGNPTDKPAGQEFVEDKKAIAKYGRIIGIFEDGRIKDPELLLKKTWEALQKNNRPIVSYELNIEELKTEDGYEHLNFKLGDIIILQNTIDNSRAKFRIIEDYKSVRNKNKRKVVVGEQLRGLTSSGSSNDDGNIVPPGGDISPTPEIDDIVPDTLPVVPVVSANGLWKSVQLSWSYESKMYYNYEVYASQIKDFEPTVFHLIYSGKASVFLHEVGPKETWYYKVRAINTYGHATEFSQQVEAHTTKVSDGTEYFESAAIKDALIGELRLDRGWIGQLDATYLNVKGKFTVLDGNDDETFKIGSFGEVTVKPSVFTLLANCVTNVPTKSEVAGAIGTANSYTDTQVSILAGQIKEKVSKTEYDANNKELSQKITEVSQGVDTISLRVTDIQNDYTTSSELQQTKDEFNFKFENTGKVNELENSDFSSPNARWYIDDKTRGVFEKSNNYGGDVPCNTSLWLQSCSSSEVKAKQTFIPKNTRMSKFSISGWVHHQDVTDETLNPYPMCHWYIEIIYVDGTKTYHNYDVRHYAKDNVWTWLQWNVEIDSVSRKGISSISAYVYKRNTRGNFRSTQLYFHEGHEKLAWRPASSETYSDNVTIDSDGVIVYHDNGDYTRMSSQGLKRHRSNGDAKGGYHYLTHYVGFTTTASATNLNWIQLPNDFKGKKFTAYSVISDTWQDSWNYGEPWVIQRFVTFVETSQIDYANARVPIRGYRIDKNYSTGDRRTKEIAGVLLVIA